MILNCTQKTKERFHIKYKEEFEDKIAAQIIEKTIEYEQNDNFLNWGVKYFSFDRRKCMQVVNFKTKFTLYLFDIKVADLENIGKIIANYLIELYKDNKKILPLLHKMLKESPICVFSKLTNKSIIASLNSNEMYFMSEGYRFYDYIEDNILKTIKINKDANWEHFITINKEYVLPAELFEKELFERYK